MAISASFKNSIRNSKNSADKQTRASMAAFKFPLVISISLILLSFVPRVQGNSALVWSFWGAAATLLLWQAYLLFNSRNKNEEHVFSVVLRPQHYIQAMVQFSVYAYWGYYWRPVYDHAWLMLAQLLFAYTFDMLLAWSRRREYSLGFGPFPIIFSINLFLWFRDDWFYMQFVMIAVGFMGKEYVRWNRDGRSSHIFNPSAFALGLFSLVLIAHQHDWLDLGSGYRIDSYSGAEHLHVPLFSWLDCYVLLLHNTCCKYGGDYLVWSQCPVFR